VVHCKDQKIANVAEADDSENLQQSGHESEIEIKAVPEEENPDLSELTVRKRKVIDIREWFWWIIINAFVALKMFTGSNPESTVQQATIIVIVIIIFTYFLYSNFLHRVLKPKKYTCIAFLALFTLTTHFEEVADMIPEFELSGKPIHNSAWSNPSAIALFIFLTLCIVFGAFFYIKEYFVQKRKLRLLVTLFAGVAYFGLLISLAQLLPGYAFHFHHSHLGFVLACFSFFPTLSHAAMAGGGTGMMIDGVLNWGIESNFDKIKGGRWYDTPAPIIASYAESLGNDNSTINILPTLPNGLTYMNVSLPIAPVEDDVTILRTRLMINNIFMHEFTGNSTQAYCQVTEGVKSYYTTEAKLDEKSRARATRSSIVEYEAEGTAPNPSDIPEEADSRPKCVALIRP